MSECMPPFLLNLRPRQHTVLPFRFHRFVFRTSNLLSARGRIAAMASSETPVNFYSGAPLNRLSWLRESATFLNTAALDSNTRWLLFNQKLDPLMLINPPGVNSEKDTRKLAFLSTAQVKPLLGYDRLFGQGQSPAESDSLSTDVIEPTELPEPKLLQAARLRGPKVVFLGIHEREGVQALPTAAFKSAQDLPGTPYFALDTSKSEPADIENLLKSASPSPQHRLEFQESRGAAAWFDRFDAPIFALGRSMVDWNSRNRFCAACGSPVYSLWGGWKLSCSSLLPWADNEGKEPCITSRGLHNFAHPRTDAVVIMGVVDETGDRILLGNNKRFPPSFYSTLAGFVEPSEAFEDSVKREIYEESGIKVRNVVYHSGQPWPFPANLMVGFYAIAEPNQEIRVDLDTELGDARWFTREEVLEVLAHPLGTTMGSSVHAKVDPEAGKLPPPPFHVPNKEQAIAGVLIHDWAHRRVPQLNLTVTNASKI